MQKKLKIMILKILIIENIEMFVIKGTRSSKKSEDSDEKSTNTEESPEKNKSVQKSKKSKDQKSKAGNYLNNESLVKFIF